MNESPPIQDIDRAVRENRLVGKGALVSSLIGAIYWACPLAVMDAKTVLIFAPGWVVPLTFGALFYWVRPWQLRRRTLATEAS